MSSLERKLSSGAAEGSAAVSSRAARYHNSDVEGGANAMHGFDSFEVFGDMLPWKAEVGGRLDIFERFVTLLYMISQVIRKFRPIRG